MVARVAGEDCRERRSKRVSRTVTRAPEWGILYDTHNRMKYLSYTKGRVDLPENYGAFKRIQ